MRISCGWEQVGDYLLLVLVELSLVHALVASRAVLCISEVIYGLSHMLGRDWDIRCFNTFHFDHVKLQIGHKARQAVGAHPAGRDQKLVSIITKIV